MAHWPSHRTQKSKLDKIRNWEESPLKYFDCKKEEAELLLSGCKKIRNWLCVLIVTLVMLVRNVLHHPVASCKKCCVKHCIIELLECKCQCKCIKDHTKAMMQKELANTVVVDGVDVTVGVMLHSASELSLLLLSDAAPRLFKSF